MISLFHLILYKSNYTNFYPYCSKPIHSLEKLNQVSKNLNLKPNQSNFNN